MITVPRITLDALIELYDVFFIDQFGVLRDDRGAYDGATSALQRVKDAGKTVVVLSNSGRSGEYNAKRLVKLGFSASSFDHFVTSGDVAFSILSAADSPIKSGALCFTISSGDDTNLAERLGLKVAKTALEADLLVISGSEAERISMDDYRQLLQPAAQRQLPCFCTNPDIHKLVGGSIAPGAGSIAKLYESLGGDVRWLGKPYREIYDFALTLASAADRRQVVCIGDSVEHDILGAQGVGLASVLVETGVLSSSTEAEKQDLFLSVATPTYLLSAFR
ncbi:TIGR01459 family HAD-type hydrolase [Neorhizobium sp. P12A]|uniref:TIGR01459 family HAD-type hydrolase n=1 Tax=Neorhizobium sp. P12A TaxID=2268027 RepID=UPI0011EDF929|nr:TIGR01459 family HAD-type hydrolase [Neorhizobium sp. P12A]KAA0689132.1 TIGR01459 family HAD-type hydrolase [Neorhizobium sp. P12A]